MQRQVRARNNVDICMDTSLLEKGLVGGICGLIGGSAPGSRGEVVELSTGGIEEALLLFGVAVMD